MSRLALIVFLAFAAPAIAQPAKPPTAAEVLRHLEETFREVQDFTVTMEGNVSMENVRVPRMTATMYFKRPDKVHFVSSSFSMVPREGMSPNPERWQKEYDATLVGRDTAFGRPVWKLQLAAKDSKVRLRQAYVWVDPSNWTLVRLTSMPYGGRTITFEFEYDRVDGRFWLPSKLTAFFGSLGEKAEPMFKAPEGAPSPAQQLEEMQRTIRSGSVAFSYRAYRVNTGLPDSIFVAPERR